MSIPCPYWTLHCKVFNATRIIRLSKLAFPAVNDVNEGPNLRVNTCMANSSEHSNIILFMCACLLALEESGQACSNPDHPAASIDMDFACLAHTFLPVQFYQSRHALLACCSNLRGLFLTSVTLLSCVCYAPQLHCRVHFRILVSC